MPLRVALADDNFLVRQGTAALLAEVEDVEVVAVAEDTASLLRAVADEAPDAVLTDLRMPPTYSIEGLEAARQIRRRHPDTGVVVLSQYIEPEDVIELLRDGDRKSTRLNSSHANISYAVFCLKKKNVHHEL